MESMPSTPPAGRLYPGRQGGGIGWGLSPSIEQAVIDEEIILDNREYHTFKR